MLETFVKLCKALPHAANFEDGLHPLLFCAHALSCTNPKQMICFGFAHCQQTVVIALSSVFLVIFDHQ